MKVYSVHVNAYMYVVTLLARIDPYECSTCAECSTCDYGVLRDILCGFGLDKKHEKYTVQVFSCKTLIGVHGRIHHN